MEEEGPAGVCGSVGKKSTGVRVCACDTWRGLVEWQGEPGSNRALIEATMEEWLSSVGRSIKQYPIKQNIAFLGFIY